MATGERFASLNFKSLTEIKSFHAEGFAMFVRPHRELCDLSWVTGLKDSHKLWEGDLGGQELTELQLKVLGMLTCREELLR